MSVAGVTIDRPPVKLRGWRPDLNGLAAAVLTGVFDLPYLCQGLGIAPGIVITGRTDVFPARVFLTAFMRAPVREWLWRYLPAELVSIAGTLLPALILAGQEASRLDIALAGTWGGNIGYFGTILLRDILKTRRGLQVTGHPYTRASFLKNLRDLVIEFGLAEMLDSLLVRPALMYWLPLWTGSLTWGLIAAKFLADLTFYLPAIFFYEWNKKRKARKREAD